MIGRRLSGNGPTEASTLKEIVDKFVAFSTAETTVLRMETDRSLRRLTAASAYRFPHDEPSRARATRATRPSSLQPELNRVRSARGYRGSVTAKNYGRGDDGTRLVKYRRALAAEASGRDFMCGGFAFLQSRRTHIVKTTANVLVFFFLEAVHLTFIVRLAPEKNSN